jgi:hypothetical protein
VPCSATPKRARCAGTLVAAGSTATATCMLAALARPGADAPGRWLKCSACAAGCMLATAPGALRAPLPLLSLPPISSVVCRLAAADRGAAAFAGDARRMSPLLLSSLQDAPGHSRRRLSSAAHTVLWSACCEVPVQR